jgi:hypothetical protein
LGGADPYGQASRNPQTGDQFPPFFSAILKFSLFYIAFLSTVLRTPHSVPAVIP